MIRSNQKIFLRLIDWAQKSERVLVNLNSARWIRTTEEDKAWLKDLEIGDIRVLSPRVRTARFSYAGRNFFAAVGFGETTEPDSILEPVELNAGIGTALISDLNVPIREGADPLAIINEILPQFEGSQGYAGHPFASVASYFEPLSVFEIGADSAIMPDQLARLSCFWILQNRERLVLPFSQATREELEELTATGAASVPFDVMLNCIQSTQWQHAFLEAYRCVERLFSFQLIEDLHKDLALSISLLKFAEKIESAIGWRPREEDAIERIINFLPMDGLNLMERVRASVNPNPTEKLHRWVYDLRNSVVHFRPATRQFPLTDAQWDEVLRATVLLIRNVYGAYDSHLQAA